MNITNVFGGTGFIGSRYCQLYLEEVVLQDREDNAPKTKNILYFISTTDNYSVFTDPELDVNTNLVKLMKVLANLPKEPDTVFNFISSWFVYGETKLPAKESSYCNPKGFYSITKRCAEQLIISFCETYKIKYRILRLCSVYGETDKNVSKRKNAMQYLVSQIKESKPIDLYWGGNFIRDFMYVDDVCRAINLVLQKGETNSIINIGNGVPCRFKNIINYVVKKTKSTSIINSVPPSEFHKLIQVKDIHLDITKLLGLGFYPSTRLSEGLDKLL